MLGQYENKSGLHLNIEIVNLYLWDLIKFFLLRYLLIAASYGCYIEN